MTTDDSIQAKTFQVKVVHTFDKDRVECLLISAFEGGSNYWIKRVRCRVGQGDVYEAAFDRGLYVKVLPEGGDPNGNKEFFLGPTSMQSGMQVMADKFQHHMADFINENDDATTADVWLQCCLFGDVIYG